VSPAEFAAVTAVGVVVGVDLVSVPQAMTSRPLVAAFAGGWLLGHPAIGLLAGVVLELFALETLPVGAARYPDWGPPAVAAGALLADGVRADAGAGVWPGLLATVLVASAVAWLGGWTMQLLRHANGAAIRRHAERLERGDPRALVALQAGGFVRDVARAAALTVIALVPGGFVARLLAARWRGPSTVAEDALIAVAVGAAAWSAWRLFGHGRTRRWLLAGLVAGCAGALLWV
jgi:mannose/fructose/N-acetylgalactosamine-specific phosphotransferase system component IIC